MEPLAFTSSLLPSARRRHPIPSTSPRLPAPARHTHRHNLVVAKASDDAPISFEPPQLKTHTPIHWRLPLVGTVIDALNPENIDLALARRYGPVFRTAGITRCTVFVSHLASVAYIMKHKHEFLMSGAMPGAFADLVVKDTIVSSDGPRHDRLRSVVLPAFAMSLLPSYFPKALSSARLFWDGLVEATGPSRRVDDGTFRELARTHFLRIIVDITTSARPTSDEGLSVLFERISDAFSAVPYTPIYFDAVRARKELIVRIREQLLLRLRKDRPILRRLRHGDESTLSQLRDRSDVDLLMILLANSTISLDGDGIGSDAISAADDAELDSLSQMVIELWFAGYFTQTTTLLFAISEIANDAHLRNDLIAEQDTVPELSVGAIQKEMPLLTSFLSEVLRMYPPAFQWFHIAAQDVWILGHHVKKGELLTLSLWAAQRDATAFTNPNEFDATRFLTQGDSAATAAQMASNMISFGPLGGSRFCIGAALAKNSLRATLAMWLREYEVQVVPRKSLDTRTLPSFEPIDGVTVLECNRRVAAM